MLLKNVRVILVMLAVVLVYGRVCIAETWKMMKVTLIWTVILGMIVVAVVGCGGDDRPIKEEMPQPATESSNPYVPLVLGTWHLQTITFFENGVQTQSMDFSLVLFTVTFKLDKTFEVISKYPIEEAVNEILRPAEWEDIQDIVVTFPGRYGIDEKQLRFYVDRARVEPKDAGEVDSDFEDPIFFYHIGRKARPLAYSLVNNGDQLELVVKEDKNRAEFIHHRIKRQ